MSDAVSLLGPAEIRRLADQLDVRPSKRRGQNFVIDANTVRRIASVAAVAPDEHVLEVGPGLGSLTLALLERGARVTAVEIEPRLAEALPATVAAHAAPERAAALSVVPGDALEVEVGGAPTVLVANLPYNVAVPVLLHAWRTVPTLQRAVVMVQLEVAERLTAAPGSRVYGVPSVKLAWYCRAELAGRMRRQVFWPEPRVDSALVAMTRQSPPPHEHADVDLVFSLVNAAFGQRRKMLRSSLADALGSAARPTVPDGGGSEAEGDGAATKAAQGPAWGADVFAAAGVDPTFRAERLDIADFTRLAEAVASRAGGAIAP